MWWARIELKCDFLVETKLSLNAGLHLHAMLHFFVSGGGKD
jgi:hypothetical protein